MGSEMCIRDSNNLNKRILVDPITDASKLIKGSPGQGTFRAGGSWDYELHRKCIPHANVKMQFACHCVISLGKGGRAPCTFCVKRVTHTVAEK